MPQSNKRTHNLPQASSEVDSKALDDYTHYHRTCLNCGMNWWGLHCPHDGYQNPCPQCDETPEPLPDKYCDCEFVMPVLIAQQTLTAQKEALLDEVLKQVVGEDVEVPRPQDDISRDRFYRRSGQNFLRHQQRDTIKEMRRKL